MNRRIIVCCVALLMAAAAACGGGKSNTAASSAPQSNSPSSSSESDVLFEENFASNANRWPERSDSPDFSSSVKDGGYQVKVVTDSTVRLAADTVPIADSVSVEADITTHQASGSAHIGVFCRRSVDGRSEYEAFITPNGFWEISRRVDGKSATVVAANGLDEAITFVKGKPHVVRLDCNGGSGEEVELTLTLDGTEVASETDAAPLQAGTSGVHISGIGTDVTVSRFILKKLAGVESESTDRDPFG